MKKLFAILAVAGFMTACNNAAETTATPSVDSAKIADSIAAATKAAATNSVDTAVKAATNAMDTASKMMDKAADKMKEGADKMVDKAKEAVKH